MNNKNRKKIWIAALLVVFTLASATLAGCDQTPLRSGEKLSIVCTLFPQYDWIKNIMGGELDNVELSLLMDDKVDLHNYQPSVDDIVKISNCDLFIYVGGESDAWVDDALEEAEAVNKDMVSINLLDAIGDAAKPEEVVEGMEEEEHAHEEQEGEAHTEDEHEAEAHTEDEHEGEAHTGDEHEAEAHEVEDEHIWLSLRNAQMLCAAITDALSTLDAENAEAYESNLSAYNTELSALDSEYQKAVESAPVKTILVGDRFPFRYLTDDYGIDYYAAFVGCSAETEASFETIIFLAEKTDELSLKNIIVTESSDQSIAETIRDNTAGKGQQILVLDAMQSIARSDIDKGASYIAIMERNLEVLKEALN